MTVTESTTPRDQEATASPPVPLRVRYRIRFAKTDLLRWISHRDLARLWERVVRRAALNLSMSEGFHPKPRIGFPSALALGVIGLDEVVELELAEELTPQQLLGRLQQDDQPGLTINSVHRLPDAFGKAQLKYSDYTITIVAAADLDRARQAIETLLGQDSVSFARKDKIFSAEVATQIPQLQIGDGELQLQLMASDSASLRPTDVLHLLGLDDWVEQGATITRTAVTLQREFESDDPRFAAVAHATTPMAAADPTIPDESVLPPH
jgi:radical SAM-linked protein